MHVLEKCIFINLFTDIRISKKKYIDFFCSYEFLPTLELELFVVEFLPTLKLELFMVEFLPMLELEIFEIEYSLAPESGIL